MKSWGMEYQGGAPEALFQHMCKNFSNGAEIYTNYLSIVQSSGMGKSRTVDELSKTHFIIPLCLRSADQQGLLITLRLTKHF